MNHALCLLTLNAASNAPLFLQTLASQLLDCTDRLIIDSQSEDQTVDSFSAAGFRVKGISRNDFNHGTTRQLAVNLLPDADILVFMTQDAILAGSRSLQTLVDVFQDANVGAAYGRQLPAAGANRIATHARLFNYPPESRLKSIADIAMLGIKTAFISNSFAAYRRSALEAVGGFPRCIVSEDTYVAAKMLLAGWEVAYCADAQVYHSHNYNWHQEFQRYFDVGVFHAREPWVRKEFGGAEGEGGRFITSEVKYLFRYAPYLLPSAFVRTVIKYLGFRCGLAEQYLPSGLKSRLSMQKAFWLQEGRGSDAARTVEAD